MATTGFWPVKGSLKAVIEYADNPDKTTEKKYLDSDLAKVVQYAANDDKTDKMMYVSGIHCTKDHAYEDMLAVQKRFGLRGSNVAYHGFQSFKPDEVTPEEAHRIGIQTAKEMWGDRYQVLVTTHLNTDSVHNHMVVNAVSFVDGRKFQNHIGDHIELRKISDRLCLEYGLSILQDAPFYGGEKKAYWIHKNGGKTHRDILKEDIKECIRLSYTYDDFYGHLYERGYEYDYTRHSVKAPGWGRAVRLDRMGFSREDLREMILKNSPRTIRSFAQEHSYHPQNYMQYPLLKLEKKWEFEMEYSHDIAVITLDLVFLIMLELVKLVTGTLEPGVGKPQLLSPELRMACARMDELTAQATLLGRYNIHTEHELKSFISEKTSQVSALEKERQKCWNKLKSLKSPERADEIKTTAKSITEQIRPLRKDLKTAKNTLNSSEKYRKLLHVEHAMEVVSLNREKARAKSNRDRGREG